MTEHASSSPNPTRVWAVLWSSSIALAAITGLLYFVGGANYEGSSYALGLNYLAGLQPAEYIFSGAGHILIALAVLGCQFAFTLWFVLVALGPAGISFKGKQYFFPRAWEFLYFAISVVIETLVPLIFAIRAETGSRNLLTAGSCPITKQGSQILPLLILVGLVVFTGVLSRLFHEKRWRFILVALGTLMSCVCLYSFGWSTGVARLYDKGFLIAEISGPSLELP